MKICKRGLSFFQVIDAHGNCRTCCWMKNNYIGNLLDCNIEQVYHGKLAQQIREKLGEENYELCPIDNCPYLANGTIKEQLVEVDEIPKYPTELYLAYEGKCNYQCTCCTSYKNMEETKAQDWSANYDVIERQIKEVLPYVKKISANGRGELFCSNRMLSLLREWRPLAPKGEISVTLETNGSLFNETNWKKIENLGQYYLKVAITVMSFQEDAYQYLSGTKLPVTNIINNLHYVKSLREKGIINELEVATVLQERNFREMPEFTRRCIEEFGVDSVRIRPIMPGGPLDPSIQWFMDVRNPYHPYYAEYKNIMKDPIFSNPKVLLWSGNCDSEREKIPGAEASALAKKQEKMLSIIENILLDTQFVDKLKNYLTQMNADSLAIYGAGRVAQTIVTLNRINGNLDIKYLIDKYSSKEIVGGYSVIRPEAIGDQNQISEAVLITVLSGEKEIEKELQRLGYNGKFFTITDVMASI